MRRIATLIVCLLALQMGWAQYMPTATNGYNSEPALTYADILKGKRVKKVANTELTDALTQRRRQMRAFVPEGNYFFGISGGYLTMNTNHTDLVFSGMENVDMRLHGYSLMPYVGYAVRTNCILGLRLGYGALHGDKPFCTEYADRILQHTYTDVDYDHTLYTAELLWRGYVPLDSRLRWAFFLDAMFGYRGGNGSVLSNRDNVPYRSNFSLHQIQLGVRPGIALALTNHVSIDLSVGLANVNFAMQYEKNRDGEKNRDNELRLCSLMDIANFQLGLTFNY